MDISRRAQMFYLTLWGLSYKLGYNNMLAAFMYVIVFLRKKRLCVVSEKKQNFEVTEIRP